MKNLKFILPIIVLLFSFTKTQAQTHNKPNKFKEKILKKKLIFFKENLKLNKEEAQKFEKIYVDYVKQKQALKQKLHEEVISKIRKENISEMTEKELNILIDKKMGLDKKKFQIEQDLIINLRKIFPPVKVVQYYKLERKFNKKLIQRLKNRRDARRNRREMRNDRLR